MSYNDTTDGDFIRQQSFLALFKGHSHESENVVIIHRENDVWFAFGVLPMESWETQDTRIRPRLIGNVLSEDSPPIRTRSLRPFSREDLRRVIDSMNAVLADLQCKDSGASLEIDNVVQDQIKQCFLCDICSEVLIRPYTCSVCLHSYCKKCIFAELDGDEDVDVFCPVEGCGANSLDGFQPTLLGPDPLNPLTGKIKPDPILSRLTRKLFGVDKLTKEGTSVSKDEDSEIERVRRMDENCVPYITIDESLINERGVLRTIKPGVRKMKESGNVQSAEDASEQLEYTTVAVLPFEDDSETQTTDFCYFRLPSEVPLTEFAFYLNFQFDRQIDSFFCRGILIEDQTLTLMEIYDEFWTPFIDNNKDELFTLKYTSLYQ